MSTERRAYEPDTVHVGAHHVIDGVAVAEGDPMTVRRPSDGSVHAELPQADDATIDRAVASAAHAQAKWRTLKPRERGRRMRAWADLIMTNLEEIARLESVVSSRPIAECRAIDVPSAAEYLRYYGEWCDKLEGSITASGEDAVSMVVREPYGVVAIVTPWNFPVILSTWKIAPAIAAGNAVVLKPSEMTPFSMTRIAMLAVEAGLPEGLVNVVHGEGADVGKRLTTHPGVSFVSFTGSTAVGGRIMSDVGLSGLKPVSLELGGKSPQLVFADCGDLDTVADHVTWGITRNAGQLCYAGSRLVVEREIVDDLVARIATRMAALQPGATWDEGTTLAPIISAKQADRIETLVASTVAEGARADAGGRGFKRGEGRYFEPTVLTGLTPGMSGYREEIFGPVLGVQVFAGEEAGVEAAQHPTYGLTASVFTQDGGKALRAAKALRSGTVWVNRWGRTADMMTSPFGGYGQSGFGRESGRNGVEGFSRLKSIWIEHGQAVEMSHSATR